MKIQHAVALLLLAGCLATYAQQVTPARPAFTTYVMTFDDSRIKALLNPDLAQIRSAVAANEDFFGLVFRIDRYGTDGTKQTLQVIADGGENFWFEYTSASGEVSYSEKRDFSTDETVKIVWAYRCDAAHWVHMLKWERDK